MQKDLGMKWLKACKILWLIGAAISLSSIWLTLIWFATVFSAFPAYTVICIALCLVNSFLTVLAYTAVGSFCASRFKYIIALFAIAPISAGVNAYGGVIMADLGTRLAVSGVCFLITALAWSLPNIIYFMHRKHLFTGTDQDNYTAEPISPTDARSETKAAEEKPQHGIETRKVKVIPVKIGSDKQEGKAKQSKGEQQENEKQVVSVKSVKKNPISLYVFIILFVVASVVCVWQAAQLSAARDDVTTLQGTVSAAEAKIKVQASEIKKQNRIIDGLYDQIDKLHGEVNRLLGYRKYLTAADIEDLERSYQESLDETREITRKYG
jgi:cell division protein FtsL